MQGWWTPPTRRVQWVSNGELTEVLQPTDEMTEGVYFSNTRPCSPKIPRISRLFKSLHDTPVTWFVNFKKWFLRCSLSNREKSQLKNHWSALDIFLHLSEMQSRESPRTTVRNNSRTDMETWNLPVLTVLYIQLHHMAGWIPSEQDTRSLKERYQMTPEWEFYYHCHLFPDFASNLLISEFADKTEDWL